MKNVDRTFTFLCILNYYSEGGERRGGFLNSVLFFKILFLSFKVTIHFSLFYKGINYPNTQ